MVRDEDFYHSCTGSLYINSHKATQWELEVTCTCSGVHYRRESSKLRNSDLMSCCSWPVYPFLQTATRMLSLLWNVSKYLCGWKGSPLYVYYTGIYTDPLQKRKKKKNLKYPEMSPYTKIGCKCFCSRIPAVQECKKSIEKCLSTQGRLEKRIWAFFRFGSEFQSLLQKVEDSANI